MTIEALYRVQCRCERYLPKDSSTRKVLSDSDAAALFLSFSSAYEEAVRRGWSAYPLLCPDCAKEMAQRAKEAK